MRGFPILLVLPLLLAPSVAGSAASLAEGTLELSCVGVSTPSSQGVPIGRGCYAQDQVRQRDQAGVYAVTFSWTAGAYDRLEVCVATYEIVLVVANAGLSSETASSCVAGVSPLTVSLPASVRDGGVKVRAWAQGPGDEVKVWEAPAAPQAVSYALSFEPAA